MEHLFHQKLSIRLPIIVSSKRKLLSTSVFAIPFVKRCFIIGEEIYAHGLLNIVKHEPGIFLPNF